MSETKYGKLVHRFKPEHSSRTIDGKDIKYDTGRIYFRGACQIPGSDFNVGFDLVKETGTIDRYPHIHDADEYLLFGSATLNSKDWDAHVELTLGLGDEAEVISIDQPMTIRIPAGLWHGPLNFVRIATPVYFQAALQLPMFEGTYLMPDGEKKLVYNGQIECTIELGKQCDCCKKCLTLSWESDG